MRVLTFLMLMGCTEVRVVIGHEATGCENYDPDNPPEEVLDYVTEELAIEVFRDGVIQPCDVDFDPDISLDGSSIEVREYWTESSDVDCTTCFVPRILIKDPSPGHYEVEWYLEDAEIPFDNVQIEVD